MNIHELGRYRDVTGDSESPRKLDSAREQIKHLALLDEEYKDVPINLTEFEEAIVNSALPFSGGSDASSTFAVDNIELVGEICKFLTT